MAQYMFGTGQLYGMPVGGGDPLRFGALQDVSVDITADIKQLYGQYQFPLAVARGKVKIEGKAMTGQVDPGIYNSLYFGQSTNTGAKVPIFSEAHTIPGTPYQVVVTNGATFYLDLGVYDATTGARYQQVASGPITGQYTVDSTTGTYTFAAADTTKNVVINYIYTDSGVGLNLNIANELMGVAPTWQLVLTETFNSRTFVLCLYSCTSSKLTFPFKQDDFSISELDFQAQANDAGNVGFISASLTTP